MPTLGKQLELLQGAVPKWAKVEVRHGSLSAEVDIILPSGRSSGSTFLKIVEASNTISVWESKTRRWPKGCPERHINFDGSFCLGVGSTNKPSCLQDAHQWWESLSQFIHGQEFASQMRYWPSNRALHHGDAYKFQLEMERLAKGTDLEADVKNALENQEGWLATDLPRLTKLGEALTNLRSPCPAGCRKRRAILRRNCPNKSMIYELVKLEAQRRQEEEAFWKAVAGYPCCGTMNNCPLNKIQETSQ